MKNRLCIILGLVLLISSCDKKTEVAQDNSPKNYNLETLLGKNEWHVKAAIFPYDTNSVLKVIYTDELGLQRDSVYCMALFENDKEYKLVAPWIDKHITIQKANVLKNEIQIVPKREVKE